MTDTVDLSRGDCIQIATEVAMFLMHRAWNAPPANTPGVIVFHLSRESVQEIADELAAMLV